MNSKDFYGIGIMCERCKGDGVVPTSKGMFVECKKCKGNGVTKNLTGNTIENG